MAVLLFASIPLATRAPGPGRRSRSLNVLLWAMIAYETRGYGEARAEVRHGDAAPGT